MKVLQMIPYSGPGGAESIVASLSGILASAGLEVAVASTGHNPHLFQKLENLGVEGVHLRSKKICALIGEICHLIKVKQPNILHSHMFDANVPAAIAAALCRLPIILTLHSTVYEFDSSKRRLAYRIIRKLSHKFVGVSSSVTSGLINVGVPATRVTGIHNGVDVTKFSGEKDLQFRKDLGIPAESPLVGMIANLRPAKDHVLAIQAAAAVIDKIPNACFVFVGDGVEAGDNDLTRVRSELRLDKNVWFAGLRNDIPSILSSLDLFVLASKVEGLPVTIIEAMSAGLPVVASDVGGVYEVVVHGQTGFLVPASDLNSLADRILEIISNKELAASLGEAGRERAIQGFSTEVMASAYRNLYEESINRRRGWL
jgi:glycosyltransferase involved in cell wall biosynthesis